MQTGREEDGRGRAPFIETEASKQQRLKNNENAYALQAARDDARSFGTGFMRVTMGDDGQLINERIAPEDIFIVKED